MIAVEDVTVRFGGAVALDGVTARLAAPIVGLVGPNGAGKTTLMNVVSGFVSPTRGGVTLDGRRLAGGAGARARAGLRRTFQQETVAPNLTVEENVRAAWDHLGTGDRRVQVARALRLTGLEAAARVPGAALDLFRRRLCEVARALVGEPRAILMDEPGAGLDEAESAALRRVVAAIPDAVGAQVVIIDHDPQLISDLCGETLVLDFGRVLAFGPTRAVLDDPGVRRAYLGTT